MIKHNLFGGIAFAALLLISAGVSAQNDYGFSASDEEGQAGTNVGARPRAQQRRGYSTHCVPGHC